jgi:hypothetical protein
MAKNSPLFIELGQGLSLMTGLPTVNSWDNENRPKKPKKGTLGFNTETYELEYWDGSDWYGVPLSKA